MGDCVGCCILCTYFTSVLLLLVFVSLYTALNPPELSIVEFSVPALNETFDQTLADIYFDLKLRNMNKAVGLYYDDPSSIAFSYYPPKEPFQKYVWASTLTPFYQGNGKTKHIRTSMDGNHLQLPSTVVVENVVVPVPVVSFRINVVVHYRFKLLWDSSTHELEVGADVMVYANTGERVSKGSIKLVN